MPLADGDDLRQEIALAQLEAALDKRLAGKAAARWHKMTQSSLLGGVQHTPTERHVDILRTVEGDPAMSQWERVELALLYSTLSCPVCGATGEWVDDEAVPSGAMYVDYSVRRRRADDDWWEHYRGPRRGIGVWICHGRQMHATQRPATRARHVR